MKSLSKTKLRKILSWNKKSKNFFYNITGKIKSYSRKRLNSRIKWISWPILTLLSIIAFFALSKETLYLLGLLHEFITNSLRSSRGLEGDFDSFNYISILVGAVALILGALTLHFARKAYIGQSDQIKELKQESLKNDISRSWEIVSRKSVGNSGKIEALQNLAKHKIPLVGIDLSSKNNSKRIYLRGLDLSKKNIGHKVILEWANFTGAYLREAKFYDVSLCETKFINTNLAGADFENCNLYKADFTNIDILNGGIKFKYCDLTRAIFPVFEDLTIFEFFDFEPWNIIRFESKAHKNFPKLNHGYFKIKILLRDQDENIPESWQELNNKIFYKGGYQPFKLSNNEKILIKDYHKLGEYYKIKIQLEWPQFKEIKE